MTKLSEFLGGLVNNISEARVNSDIQTVQIAQEYAKNELLKHFAVPRMRVDKVELNIPIAIETLPERNRGKYEPFDSKAFSAKASDSLLNFYQQNFGLQEHGKNDINKIIDEFTRVLENRIKNEEEIDNAATSKELVSEIDKRTDSIFRKPLNQTKYTTARKKVIELLQDILGNSIKRKAPDSSSESVQIIAETHKLSQFKLENLIMIKMTVSEQGMEWISMENSEGKVVNKLMPE